MSSMSVLINHQMAILLMTIKDLSWMDYHKLEEWMKYKAYNKNDMVKGIEREQRELEKWRHPRKTRE